jgi:two-component system response regulator RegX3
VQITASPGHLADNVAPKSEALASRGRPVAAAGNVPLVPAVGTTVLVAHPLGAEGVAADLQGSGFEVVVATESSSALQGIVGGAVDIALVDGRFAGDGVGFCHQVWAQRPGFPVLVAGPNDEDMATRALCAGADDYLVLPLRPSELVARLRAVLRRAPTDIHPNGPAWSALTVGDVTLDDESHVVTLRGQHVHLPLREFELLRLLMRNAGIVLSRATLMTKLWGPQADPESTSVEVHVRRLRAKLEDDPATPTRIVTVRGVGYRYQAAVRN